MNFDINCDLGELDGADGLQHDARLIALVDSANVACGGHAGDRIRMRELAFLCRDLGVRFGAHPGYPDRQNFGREELPMTTEELESSLVCQLRLARDVSAETGVPVTHVKPHGALYHRASQDVAVARLLIQVTQEIFPGAELYGPEGSELIEQARRGGLPVRSEVFADRRYRANGTLVPRSRPDAVIEVPEDAVEQVMMMITSHRVLTVDGDPIPVIPETICVHGDSPNTLTLLSALRTRIEFVKHSGGR